MKALSIRDITIRVIRDDYGDGNFYSIQDGENIATHLCWDEMLGAIATMTHPQLGMSRYLTNADGVVSRIVKYGGS